MRKPAASPPMIAAAWELALASAAIRTAASGGTGLTPGPPRSLARRFRPLSASATPSTSIARAAVHGSVGSEAYTVRTTAQAMAAQTTARAASTQGRVGVMPAAAG